ncbi:hypothetical protein [Leifsonia sp. NCR5]|uniref:hypothetical protein n=1 Tax=Leifsonia sp. NCR5 TaxID=1978342 RepID=UPI00117B7B42|nr:hypothetical protein [Leifsonia sp. NCR5]
MATDFLDSALTLIGSTLAASVGAFFSARFGGRQRAQAGEAKQRRTTASMIIDRLLAVRALLREAQQFRDVADWRDAIESLYEALDDARYRLPDGFRHVKRSVRSAIGEATSLSLTDSWPRSQNDADDLADYNGEWTTNAMDYFDVVVDSLRAWRDASAKAADRTSVRSFDSWLAATNRYVPGGTR